MSALVFIVHNHSTLLRNVKKKFELFLFFHPANIKCHHHKEKQIKEIWIWHYNINCTTENAEGEDKKNPKDRFQRHIYLLRDFIKKQGRNYKFTNSLLDFAPELLRIYLA